jgi:hypothetical protein
MAHDLLDGAATPERIAKLVAAGVLSGDDAARAYALASATPSRAAWARLLDRTLLVLGALLAVAGVVFFFAFNWAKLPAFTKFGLIGAGITAAVGAAHHRTLERQTGKIALVVAALLVGPLLAVYGQHYQTGADPYELFLAWVALATPWAIAARSSLLWAILIALCDTCAVLFAEQVLDADYASPWHRGAELPIILAIHVLAVVALEVSGPRGEHAGRGPHGRRALPRGVALVGAFALSLGAAWWVLDRESGQSAPGLCALAAIPLWSAMIAVYRRSPKDLAMLAIAGASIVMVVTTVIGKILAEAANSSLATLLLTGLALTGQVALLAVWLRAHARHADGE